MQTDIFLVLLGFIAGGAFVCCLLDLWDYWSKK